MKSLHWLIVGVFVVALVGVPAWYVKTGQGAQAVPGEQEKAYFQNIFLANESEQRIHNIYGH